MLGPDDDCTKLAAAIPEISVHLGCNKIFKTMLELWLPWFLRQPLKQVDPVHFYEKPVEPLLIGVVNGAHVPHIMKSLMMSMDVIVYIDHADKTCPVVPGDKWSVNDFGPVIEVKNTKKWHPIVYYDSSKVHIVDDDIIGHRHF